MAERGVPGFFGKLPSRGDFVSRRLPPEFVRPWDAWLQDAVASAQAELGSQWLDVYLTSPVWCFALSAGICGDSAYAGVLIPSVDKVGRYFPLVAAVPYGGAKASLCVRRELEPWYLLAQDLLLETLEEPALDLEEFDERLANLGATVSSPELEWNSPARPDENQAAGWQFLAPDSVSPDILNAALLSNLLTRELGAHSVWWTSGSDRVSPSSLIVRGLPPAKAFTAMLDGNFGEEAWVRGSVQLADAPAMLARSAAISDPGKVRTINEDSFACRDDLGVWIVADGLGGHQAGEIASAMVVRVAETLPASSVLSKGVEQLRQSLRVVNGSLRVLAERNENIAMAGSTVAALIVKGAEAAFVWAGDSRIYRLRDRSLTQLTRDHAEGEGSSSLVSSGDEVVSRAVTRAVGGDGMLDLDVLHGDVRAEDRYLLCTDGVYTAVGDDDLARALALGAAEDACAELKRLVLEGAATDNLTAIVVHIEPVASATESGFINDR